MSKAGSRNLNDIMWLYCVTARLCEDDFDHLHRGQMASTTNAQLYFILHATLSYGTLAIISPLDRLSCYLCCARLVFPNLQTILSGPIPRSMTRNPVGPLCLRIKAGWLMLK